MDVVGVAEVGAVGISRRIGDWLVVGGGAVMLVLAQLLDWATVDTDRGSGGLHGPFDYPFTGGIAWVLTVVVGVVTLLAATGLVRLGRTEWPLLVLGAAGVATALMVLRVVLGAGDVDIPRATYPLDRGAGMWAALVGAALGLVGAVANAREEAGSVGELLAGRSGSMQRRRAMPPPSGPVRRGPSDATTADQRGGGLSPT